MAYISQEEKKKLMPNIKKLLAKYRVQGSVSINNHSTLVLNIKSGEIDFIGNYNKVLSTRGMDNAAFCNDYMQVNTYWAHEQFDGKAQQFLVEMIAAMKGEGWFDKSDIQTDYFHVKHYVDINIGKWERPYIYSGQPALIQVKSEQGPATVELATSTPSTVDIERFNNRQRFRITSGAASFYTTAQDIRVGVGDHTVFNDAVQKALDALEYQRSTNDLKALGLMGTWSNCQVQIDLV